MVSLFDLDFPLCEARKAPVETVTVYDTPAFNECNTPVEFDQDYEGTLLNLYIYTAMVSIRCG